jgi:transcriptional regulator with XRE-family HTH domain
MANGQTVPFGALLKRYRAAAQLTQEQLAAGARLSPNTITALERGKLHTLRGATIQRLAPMRVGLPLAAVLVRLRTCGLPVSCLSAR